MEFATFSNALEIFQDKREILQEAVIGILKLSDLLEKLFDVRAHSQVGALNMVPFREREETKENKLFGRCHFFQGRRVDMVKIIDI
jgi:hypothetical protein